MEAMNSISARGAICLGMRNPMQAQHIGSQLFRVCSWSHQITLLVTSYKFTPLHITMLTCDLHCRCSCKGPVNHVENIDTYNPQMLADRQKVLSYFMSAKPTTTATSSQSSGPSCATAVVQSLPTSLQMKLGPGTPTDLLNNIRDSKFKTTYSYPLTNSCQKSVIITAFTPIICPTIAGRILPSLNRKQMVLALSPLSCKTVLKHLFGRVHEFLTVLSARIPSTHVSHCTLEENKGDISNLLKLFRRVQEPENSAPSPNKVSLISRLDSARLQT